MKKFVFVVILLIFGSCFIGRFDVCTGFFSVNVAYAESEQQELEEEIEQQVQKQIENLNFTEIETALQDLSEEAKEIFSSNSFLSKVGYVMSGQYSDNSKSFFASVLSVFFSGLKKSLPLIATIISISILGGMISALRPMSSNGSIGNIIHFVTYGIILVILGTSIS